MGRVQVAVGPKTPRSYQQAHKSGQFHRILAGELLVLGLRPLLQQLRGSADSESDFLLRALTSQPWPSPSAALRCVICWLILSAIERENILIETDPAGSGSAEI